MVGYGNFVVQEAVNTHLVHLEDAIFESGSQGLTFVVSLLTNLLDSLHGNSTGPINVTTKFDGSPAIFCGTDPSNGRFFVATKSLFNKAPKVNYTVEDIRNNHEGELVVILSECLKYLSGLNIKGIIQGDLLFLQKNLFTMTSEGEKYVAFQPNTLAYAIPANTELAAKISVAKIGIVFHTEYHGNSLGSLSASFILKKNKKLHSSKDVFITTANVEDLSGTISLTNYETQYLRNTILEIQHEGEMLKGFMDKLKDSDAVKSLFNIFINNEIRNTNVFINTADFVKFVRGRETKPGKNDSVVEFIRKNNSDFERLITLRQKIMDCKLVFLEKLNHAAQSKVFVRHGDEFKVTGQEGFVISDHLTSSAVKLVDRVVFSRSNFLQSKNRK